MRIRSKKNEEENFRDFYKTLGKEKGCRILHFVVRRDKPFVNSLDFQGPGIYVYCVAPHQTKWGPMETWEEAKDIVSSHFDID